MPCRRFMRLPSIALFLLLFAALSLFEISVSAAPSDLYAVNSDPGVIQRFDGVTGASVSALSEGNYLTGSVFGPDGALYISSAGANQILRYDPNTPKTAPVTTFIAGGSGGMNTPRTLAFGPDGALYVLSQNSILRFNGSTGAFLNTFVPAGSGGLSPTQNYIFDLAFGPDGNLYVTSGNGILQYNGTTGAFLSVFVPTGTGGFNESYGFTFGPDGKLYVANGDGSILRFSGSTGAFQDVFVPAAETVNTVFGLAFGPDGALYLSSDTNPNGGTNNSILRYNGTTGVYQNVFASLPSLANFLAFGPIPPPGPRELITNGGFETGDFTGWTVNTETGSQPLGGFYNQSATTALPVQPSQTVGPASGTRYAISSESGPTATALSQTFTVPGPAAKVTLSYDMFVNSYTANGAVIGTQGLDFTGAPNQQARVDLLSSTASPFSIAPVDLMQSFYDGVDNPAAAYPHPYTHYTFDITSLVGQGGAYTLRFAQVDNQGNLAQGVDNVSVQYTSGTPAPPAPFTIAVSPSTLMGGGPPPTLTLTLNQPAQPGPDPSGQNLGQYGAVLRLDTSPSVQIPNGAQPQGYFFHGTDGTAYVLIQTGTTTAVTPLTTSFVSATTTATVKATYASASASAPVTINPYQIQSVSVAPAAVLSGQSATATVTLNALAVPSPDPRATGQFTNGALVFLSLSPGARFTDVNGSIISQGYVLIPTGQTSVTVPISTGFVPSTDTTGVTASFNGSSVTGPFTINPTVVQSFTLSPTSVYNGTPTTATLTLNGPAVYGPNPAAPGTSYNGAIILLGTDNPAAVFVAENTTNGGGIFQGQDGHFYAAVPAGQTTIAFTINTQFVPTGATASISATLNSIAVSAPLTITPTLVKSFTVSPTSVYNGTQTTATLTLNGPAVYGPDPSRPGTSAPGAVVRLDIQYPGWLIAGNATNGGSVFQDQDSHYYAFVPAGQTTISFPVGTQFVSAVTSVNVSATLNGTAVSAALTITPTLVQSLTLTPTTVYGGQQSTLTLTLNNPAIPGPNPAAPGSSYNGAIVRLDTDSPAAVFITGNATNGGGIFQGQDGHFYAAVPAGQTTINFPVGSQTVTSSTVADLKATLNSGSQSAALTIVPAFSGAAVTQVRFFPRAGYASRMVGGRFQGSTDGVTYVDLAAITRTPAANEYATLPVTNPTSYRFLRYLAPSGSCGNVAEIDFDSSTGKIAGTPFGTPGSYNNSGNTFLKAFDGSTGTYFDAPAPGNGDFVGIDRAYAAATQARFVPRAGLASRMVGGRFQGSVDGVTYVDLATITQAPTASQYTTLVFAQPVAYRYLRYLAPNGSYGNVAEVEFDGSTGKIAGTPFGTAGSYNNSGNTFLKAFDGSNSTFFDAPAPGNGDFAGIDLGPH